jgi:hypothetical protein
VGATSDQKYDPKCDRAKADSDSAENGNDGEESEARVNVVTL